jgi:hypothetical membrane protein
MQLNQRLAALLILVGTTQFLFFLQISEFLYPSFSTSQNDISDLGATCRNSVCNIVQPSAAIFDVSIFVLGLLLLLGSYSFSRDRMSRLFCILLGLAGIGTLGVGVFPETTGITPSFSVHTLVSLTAFLFGGLAAIYSFRFLPSVLRHFSALMGVITLVALVSYGSGEYLGLGPGGLERMIAYPVLFWALVLATYFLSQNQPNTATRVFT